MENSWKKLDLPGFIAGHIIKIFEGDVKDNVGYDCTLAPKFCKATFDEFEDLATHLRDISNRDCTLEWLIRECL